MVSSFSSLGKWIPLHGKLYHFSQERVTFAKAKATCEHNFGKLFEPKTEAINNKIAAIARGEEHGIINPWIGIHRIHDEDKTVYASDKTNVVWSFWDANEPNNENAGEDCAHLYTYTYENTCYYPHVGNGYCNDEYNNEECDWDGGDCCGDNVVCSNNGNTACECFQPSFEPKQCNYEKMADGICNDESNTEECKWDMGDCCGDDVDITKCSTCECLEPFRWNDNNCEEFRRFICEKDGTG